MSVLKQWREPSEEEVSRSARSALATSSARKTSSTRATHADLAARGVEFTQPPVEQPYGIDAGFRDPWGDLVRMVQRYAPAS